MQISSFSNQEALHAVTAAQERNTPSLTTSLDTLKLRQFLLLQAVLPLNYVEAVPAVCLFLRATA